MNDNFYQMWQSQIGRDWVSQAACRGIDPELFMPEIGGNTRAAKELCNGRPATKMKPGLPPCPVKDECLEYSLQLPGPVVGVWGGLSERERREVKRSTPIRVKRFQHGTDHGYKTHKQRGTEPCESCRQAHRAAVKAWSDRRRDKLTMPALRHLVKLVHEVNKDARPPRTPAGS